MTRTASGARAREVNGVLLLDKPTGITSQTAVLKVKRLYSAAKAGHTGTLDPMASGLLPVCLGEATKFSHLMLESDKAYTAGLQLGMTTSTGDLEGAVTARAAVNVSRGEMDAVVGRFVGETWQTPPMYSALKHAGKPLYHYARAGIAVDREARRIRIEWIRVEHFSAELLCISLACSKGTYVRVLAEDIGRALGCGAALCSLRRTAVGSFALDQSFTLEALTAMADEERLACLMPVDSLVATLPRIDLDALQARKIRSGVRVEDQWSAQQGLVRLYGPQHDYIGIGTIEPQGQLVPRRLMASVAQSGGQGR